MKIFNVAGMLGYLQRKEIDLIEYPIPYDISNPPGILTTILVESGTFILDLLVFGSNESAFLKILIEIQNF